MKLQIKKLKDNARIPSFAHMDDAGMDLFTCEEVTLAPGERVQVPTGIAMALPTGHVGLIWDKSGISHTHGLKVLGGVVDAGYRGEVLVGLVNLGQVEYVLESGHKVAQMLIQKVEQPEIEEVDTLDETQRGEGGFGSTGK
ncbi:MAG: dUTP diphosphatase [Candidatus Paceibacterota bacterium]